MFAQFFFSLGQLASFLQQQTMHQPAICEGGVFCVQAAKLTQGFGLLGLGDEVPCIAHPHFRLHRA